MPPSCPSPETTPHAPFSSALPFPSIQASVYPAWHIFFPWLWWQVPCRFREAQSQEREAVGRGSRRGPSLWLLPVQKSQGNTFLPGSYPHTLSRHLPAWGQGPQDGRTLQAEAGACKHCLSLSLAPRLLWGSLGSSVFMLSPWVTLFLSVQGSCPASTDTLPSHSKAFSQEAESEGGLQGLDTVTSARGRGCAGAERTVQRPPKALWDALASQQGCKVWRPQEALLARMGLRTGSPT